MMVFRNHSSLGRIFQTNEGACTITRDDQHVVDVVQLIEFRQGKCVNDLHFLVWFYSNNK